MQFVTSVHLMGSSPVDDGPAFPGFPFDDARGVIPNHQGHVDVSLDPQGFPVPNVCLGMHLHVWPVFLPPGESALVV